MEEKKPVISTLRAMEVGEIQIFPIIQKTTIVNTISERLYLERQLGKQWSCSSDRERGIVSVRRVS